MHIGDENGARASVLPLDIPHGMLEDAIAMAMKNIPFAIAPAPVISMIKLAAGTAHNSHPAPL